MNEYQLALTEARGRIASREHDYVCFAIPKTDKCRESLQRAIQNSITPAHTIEQWLIVRGIPHEQITPEAMHEYRLRWIDKMIEDFA